MSFVWNVKDAHTKQDISSPQSVQSVTEDTSNPGDWAVNTLQPELPFSGVFKGRACLSVRQKSRKGTSAEEYLFQIVMWACLRNVFMNNWCGKDQPTVARVTPGQVGELCKTDSWASLEQQASSSMVPAKQWTVSERIVQTSSFLPVTFGQYFIMATEKQAMTRTKLHTL